MMSVIKEEVPVQSGWDRLKKFYDFDQVCFERDLVVKSVRTSFLGAFLFGGLQGRPEVDRRVQLHTTGVHFPSPSLRVVSYFVVNSG
jgi:hypothetical protein